MERFQGDGVVLEYAICGTGEPVLLIHSSVTADGLAFPLQQHQELASSYLLIAYHRRGYAGSTIGTPPVTIEQQAADAAALLTHLRVTTAHVVGHSYGGIVGLQLAHDEPPSVHSLALLEPALMALPRGPASRARTLTPVLERYRSGDKLGALDMFVSEVFGPDWRTAVEAAVPGGVSEAEESVDAFFAVDLPSLEGWALGDKLAGALSQPILSVVGTESAPFRLEARQLLHEWFDQVEDFDLARANHLLQMQNPEGMATGLSAFFRRHPIGGTI